MQEEERGRERESNEEKVWLGLSGLLFPCVFLPKGRSRRRSRNQLQAGLVLAVRHPLMYFLPIN